MPTMASLGFFDAIGHHLVELGDPLNPICDPALGEDRALQIDDADVVVLVGPVDPDEDQTSSSQLDDNSDQPRGDRWRSNGSVLLMARHPTSPHLSSPTGGGTI